MKMRDIKLEVQAGCVACRKDCNWRAKMVSKAGAGSKYGCNNSK